MEPKPGAIDSLQKRPIPDNIGVFLNPELLPPDQKGLLSKTLGFAIEASRLLGDEFYQRFKHSRIKGTGLSNPPSAQFLEANGLHLPQFDIFDSQSSRAFLEKTPFPEHQVQDENLLLVFILPRPIALANHLKYEQDYGRKSKYDWDYFSKPVRRILWQHLEKTEFEKQSLRFEKVNEVGEHDSSLFHYVWEVSLPTDSYLLKASRNGPAPAE